MNPFTRAADYIAEHGWTQGAMRSPDGQVCSLAAFIYANPGLIGREQERAGRWLARFLLSRTSDPHANYATVVAGHSYANLIPFWNDRIAVNQQQVISEFRAAAEAWDLENALELEHEAERRTDIRTYSGAFSTVQFDLDLDSLTAWFPVVSSKELFACQS